MKASLIVTWILIGFAAAIPRSSQRIVGGDPASIEQYSFMSSMQLGFLGIWFQACGGSLLTTHIVLSAAHCYFGDSPSIWRVQLGSSHPSTGGSLHQVSSIVIHEGYHPSHLSNDVALISLLEPAVLGRNVGTAKIAGKNYILADNEPVFAVGWGTLWSGGPSPETLKHVQVYTINRGVCAQRYAQLKDQPGFEGWPLITPAMSCTGVLDEGGRDACQGDSGGPVVHNRDVVAGVTSWGYNCAHHHYPGVNADVSHHAKWIVRNAQKIV